jgi:transcription antitermination factor NusG
MAWYIAITNPNCHRRAEAGLAAIGYRSFWPRLRKWVSHARVKIAKEYPVLGRYMFVEIPDGEFYTVRNVNGVEALLTGDGGAPVKVPPEVVWRFRERYMAGEWDYVANETGEFETDEIESFINDDGEEGWRRKRITRKNAIPVGALVRIMEGEFADMLAVIRGHQNGKLEFLPPGKRKFFYTRESNVRAA